MLLILNVYIKGPNICAAVVTVPVAPRSTKLRWFMDRCQKDVSRHGNDLL
jgi:hypothetical protein